jgi:PAS domain S-box-containing protein
MAPSLMPMPLDFYFQKAMISTMTEDLDLMKIFNALPKPCLILNPDLIMLSMNDAFVEVSLKTRAEMIGHNIFDIFPDDPNDPNATGQLNLRASFRKVIKEKVPDKMEIQKYSIQDLKAGSDEFYNHYWSPFNSPVIDETGEVKYIIHQVEDMTDLVRTQIDHDRLEESEKWFRELANYLPLMIWTARADGIVDWYNRWWYDFTGDVKDPYPKEKHGLIHPDEEDAIFEYWHQCVATGKPYEMECRFLRKSDSQYRWHLGRAIPITDQNGKISKWIGFNTDIHEQKMYLGQLQEERDLREKFVATLSHDLRTPLTAAKMLAEFLARTERDFNSTKDMAIRIKENIDRSDGMIRDLLDANLIKSGEKLKIDIIECDMTDVARTTIENLKTLHGDRFELTAPSKLVGYWSATGIRRVLENLINNAVKYGDTESKISISLNAYDSKISIAVHNFGQPIPQSDQDSLFKQFQRTKSAKSSNQKGWGLGLNLVKGITEAHHGIVKVESHKDVGTTFTVFLPRDARS